MITNIKTPKFKLIQSIDILNSDINREVSLPHVDRMKKLILKNGFADAIKVSPSGSKFISIEGQHRVQALVSLGVKEIPCLIIDWVDSQNKVNDFQQFVIDLNASNKTWSIIDYIKSHAKVGDKNYSYLLKKIREAKGLISAGAVASMYSGERRGNSILKKGDYFPCDEVFSDKIFSECLDLVSRCGKDKVTFRFINNLSVRIQRNSLSKHRVELLSFLVNEASKDLSMGREIPKSDEFFSSWFDELLRQFNEDK
tara:strand:+ start:599 stop:1363 length:765 start_codon:yes stop_codon:yes gene_type:complete